MRSSEIYRRVFGENRPDAPEFEAQVSVEGGFIVVTLPSNERDNSGNTRVRALLPTGEGMALMSVVTPSGDPVADQAASMVARLFDALFTAGFQPVDGSVYFEAGKGLLWESTGESVTTWELARRVTFLEDVPAEFVAEQLNLILECQARNMADSVMRDDYDTEDLVFESIREYARLYHLAQIEPYKAAVEIERAYGSAPVHQSVSESIIFEYRQEQGY